MEIIKLLSGPIIGAIIGYCTNYIAVKMLFRPYREVRIGKFKLPFTPGIIPKRQPELAHAIGKTVGESLFGGNDIKLILQSEQMKQTIVGGVSKSFKSNINEKQIYEVLHTFVDTEEYDKKKAQLSLFVTNKIVEGISQFDISQIIKEKGMEAVSQMGGLLAMFANDSMIASIATPLGKKVEEYIESDGREKIYEIVDSEVALLEKKPIEEFISDDIIDKMGVAITQMYENMLEKQLEQILDVFDVAGIIEHKISNMNVKELEILVFSVMKNELNMIVNLGALIGFILGLMNLIL